MALALIYEIGVLILLGLSGVSAGLLAGIKNPVLLAGTAIGFASLIRLTSTFGTWFLGRPSSTLTAWAISALAVTAIAVLAAWRQWRPASIGMTIFAGLSTAALGIKYVLRIGEMQHSDSTGIVSRALLVIQPDSPDISPITENPKRGLLYPIMLALGPPERILTSYTPLVFLSLALLVGWIAWSLTQNLTLTARISGLIAIGAFLATIPIVRISATYLNSHLLVAYGLTLITTSVLLATRRLEFGGSSLWIFTLGGVVAATSRVEAIVLVGILAVMTVALEDFESINRLGFFLSLLSIGGYLLLWLWGLNTPLAESFGLPYWQLALSWLVGSLMLSSRAITRYRRFIPHFLGTALAVTLFWMIFNSSNPSSLLLAQWPNFGLGEGGWATAVPILIGLLVVLGWRRQSTEYRWLVVSGGLIVMGILFTKTFDGGFGRESFYDSVNRMALHVLPLFTVALIIGVGKVFDRLAIFLTKPSGQGGRDGN